MPKTENELKSRSKLDQNLFHVPGTGANEVPEGAYGEAIAALRVLNEKISALYRPNEDGTLPVFTGSLQVGLIESYAEGYTAVAKAVAELKAEADSVMKKQFDALDRGLKLGAQVDVDKEMKEIDRRDADVRQQLAFMTEIKDLLAADISTLSDLEPDEVTTLPAVLAKARTTVVGQGEQKLDRINSESHTRYALSFTENARLNKGIFTPKRTLDGFSVEQMMKIVEDSGKLKGSQDAIDFVKLVLNEKYGGRNRFSGMHAEQLHMPRLARLNLEKKPKAQKLVAGILDEKSPHYIPELKEYINRMAAENDLYANDLHAKEGTDVSGREVAATRLSRMLGVSHTIAGSRFMQLNNGNGQAVHGIFTEVAEGKDAYSILPSDVSHFRPAGVNDVGTPALLKEVAELQVLDYLCQNLKRDITKLALKFSEDGTQITGIQGIGNDASFGTAVLGETEKNRDELFENLKVIPKEVRDRVMSMTAETMKFALGDAGLKDSEIEAAGKRLEKLQDAIAGSKIKVVADGEWKDQKLEDLADMQHYDTRKSYNYFRTIAKMKDYLPEKAQENERRLQGDEPEKEPEYREISLVTGLDRASVEVHNRRADKYVDLIRKAQDIIHTRGSKEFREMQTAAKDYRAAASSLEKDRSEENYARVMENLKTLKDKANAYLVKKGDPMKYDKRTKARIHLAEDIQNYCEKTGESMEQLRQDRVVAPDRAPQVEAPKI